MSNSDNKIKTIPYARHPEEQRDEGSHVPAPRSFTDVQDDKDRKRRPWTPARRAAQAARCCKTRPFDHATGPKTAMGKAASSRNALKHGLYGADAQALRALLRVHKDFLRSTFARMGG